MIIKYDQLKRKERKILWLFFAFSESFLSLPYSVGNKKGWFDQEQKVIAVNNCDTRQEQ